MIGPLEQPPCDPDCGPAVMAAQWQTMAGVSDVVRDAYQRIADDIAVSVQAVAVSVDQVIAALRQHIADSLDIVGATADGGSYVVADNVMAALSAVLDGVSDVIDLAELEATVRRDMPLYADTSVMMPPPPSASLIHTFAPGRTATSGTGPADITSGPTLSPAPDWVAALTDRYGGADETLAAQGTQTSGADGGMSRIMDWSSKYSPSQDVSYIGGVPDGGVGRHAGTAGTPSPPSAPASSAAGQPSSSWLVTGTPDGGSAGTTDHPAQGQCPPVHVHIHCEPGVRAAELPDESGLIAAPPAPAGDIPADAPRQSGSAPTPAEQALIDRQYAARQEALRQEYLEASSGRVMTEGGQYPLPAAEQLRPVEPAAKPAAATGGVQTQTAEQMAAGLRAVDKAFGAEQAANLAALLLQAGTVQGCATAADSAKWAGDLVSSLNKFVTGSETGDELKEGGLLHYLSFGKHQNTTLGQLLSQIMIPIWVAARRAVEVAMTLGGCNEPGFVLAQAGRVVLGVVSKWIGAEFPEARARLDYVAGELCAARIPSTQEVHSAYLADVIDRETWRCMVRANGERDDTADLAMTALRTVPSPLQITNVWQRIGGRRDQLDKMLRQAGVIESRHAEWYRLLAQYVPSPGDLVSFMLRDVFDQTVVDKYGYDESFEAKFSGKALEWAVAQGMDADQFRYYWRSHWRLPSPSQGYEMVHRLRKGRVPDSLVTDIPTVRQLLEVNDYPSYWRDRLIALSYRPLTRVDTRRAYFIGALSEQETRDAILDLGYAEREADLLLTYWRQERVNFVANQPWAKAYVRGEVPDEELRERLGRMNLSGPQVDQVEQELELRERAAARKEVVRAVKSRVVKAMTTAETATAEMVAMGYSPSHAARLVAGWVAARAAAGKHLTAQEMCRAYDLGVMTGREFLEGLSELGYSLTDARRVVALCEASKGMTPSGWGAEFPQAKEMAADRQRADELKAMRQRNMETARAARQRRALGLAEERVLKKLSAIASRLSRKLGGDIDGYGKKLRALHRYLTDELCYTRQGAADLLHGVVMDLASAKDPDWETRTRQYVESLPARPCPAPDKDPSPGPEALPEPAAEPPTEGEGQ